MEEIIKQRCEEIGITPDMLTEIETARLRKEIEADQRGERICDSVLDDPDIRLRKFDKLYQ